MPRWEETSVGGETVRAFVPDPPKVDLAFSSEELQLPLSAAGALGRLDGQAKDMIDASLFTYLYVRQEAVLSSQIEGTQSTLNDLLSYEHDVETKVPLNDVAEVSRYVKALEFGLEQLRDPQGLPISLRLLRKLHGILLAEGRGAQKQPGEFRRTQNWIGGTRPGNAAFVPPPPHLLDDLLGGLEEYLHNTSVPSLVRAGIAHAYFETLHPFLDGNGRIGRLLIPLLLINDGELSEPHLYVSLYFKKHRAEYYKRLQATRDEDDWLGWLRFFLKAVAVTANQAVDAARAAVEIYEGHRRAVDGLPNAASVLRVLEFLRRRPMVTSKMLVERISISAPTANNALSALVDAGIIEEITGKKRGRVYAYRGYIGALAAAAD